MNKVVIKLLSMALCAAICLTPITAIAKSYEVPDNNSFKTYMSYTTITNQSSNQYALQQVCFTDENGLRRYDDYFVIAVGTYYTSVVGTRIDVTLDTGRVLQCVVGDIKADVHTDAMNRQMSENGNVIEFLVDAKALDKRALRSGDISSIDGFEGSITNIDVYKTAVIGEWPSSKPEEGFAEFIVTGKEVQSIGDTVLYLVTITTTTGTETTVVSEDVYEDVVVGKSRITYDKSNRTYKIK